MGEYFDMNRNMCDQRLNTLLKDYHKLIERKNQPVSDGNGLLIKYASSDTRCHVAKTSLDKTG